MLRASYSVLLLSEVQRVEAWDLNKNMMLCRKWEALRKETTYIFVFLCAAARRYQAQVNVHNTVNKSFNVKLEMN
jgi:hypothetical protein